MSVLCLQDKKRLVLGIFHYSVPSISPRKLSDLCPLTFRAGLDRGVVVELDYKLQVCRRVVPIQHPLDIWHMTVPPNIFTCSVLSFFF